MPTSLVIHGHFYQPPRENPWTEVPEQEPSAAPFHDWNERIYQECYRANGNARISDASGLVEAIENNYLHLSFNFGPTLLSWMEREHPLGLKSIIQADKGSLATRGGHGNAIAQGYNHCILPLCNARDRHTQIHWGLREFRYRFGREAESIWLPETACNDAVLGECIDANLRYIILAPGQCQKVRKIGDSNWTMTENSDVDPGRAYKYFHKDGSGRSLALFFYDGPIARSLAFGEGLRSSQDLIHVIGRGAKGDDRIVHVATDGESYGHHTKWGDRTLAYAFKAEARNGDYRVTNYGEYLDRCPPLWEAEIKPGEGTAWSCAHGVGRWIRDCGCETGGQPGWNQKWRGPLREALDYLRDQAIAAFESGAQGLLKDPWAARNDFIHVLLDPGEESRSKFLKAHASRTLKAEEEVRALALLDMQRQAMLMYTSCGWFFNELSGIETLQIMKYACRVMDDMSDLGFNPPRREFIKLLSKAKSNLPTHGTGEDIFKKLVEPSKVSPDRLAAHLSISTLIEPDEEGRFGVYDFRFSSLRREIMGKTSLATGRLELKNRLTGRSHDFMVAAAHLGGIDFHCSVARFESEAALEESALRVGGEFRRGLIPPLLRAMREEFGVREFGLEHMLSGGRTRIAGAAFGHLIGELSERYRHVYNDNRRYLEMFQAAGFSLPAELRTAAEYTLSRRLEKEIRERKKETDPAAFASALAIAEDANRQGLQLDRRLLNELFSGMITEAVRVAMESPDSSLLQRAIGIIKLAGQFGLQPRLDLAQELAVRASDQLHAPEDLAELARLLKLTPALLLKGSKEN